MAKRKTGTIKKVGGRLYVYTTVNGRQEQVRGVSWPDTPEGHAEADRFRRIELGAEAAGLRVSSTSITVGEYVDSFLPKLDQMVRRGKIKRAQAEKYARDLRNHVQGTLWFAEERITDVDIDAIETLYDVLLEDLAPKTVSNVSTALRHLFRSARRAKLIAFNPTLEAETPSTGSGSHRGTWTPAEVAEFLRLTTSDQFGLLWRVVAVTGMRRSEALGLRWSLLDLDATDEGTGTPAGEATISGVILRDDSNGVHYSPTTKTKDSRRWVAFEEDTTLALRRHRIAEVERRLADPDWIGKSAVLIRPDVTEYQELDLVFTDEFGRALEPRRVSRHFKAACDEHGVAPIGLHGLRHSLATAGLENRQMLKTISTILGHADQNVTERVYVHLGEMAFKTEALALGRLMATGQG